MKFPGGPSEFFNNAADKMFVAKSAVYMLQALLGDGVVVSGLGLFWSLHTDIVSSIDLSMLYCLGRSKTNGLVAHLDPSTVIMVQRAG